MDNHGNVWSCDCLRFAGISPGQPFGDLGAGLTVGLIALPLAIGCGIASGVTPQQGLWTGIIASVVVALLGGSRFQVAGPTGAFVPVLFSVVAMYGYGGLALAAMMAGVMLILLGAQPRRKSSIWRYAARAASHA